MALCSVVLRYLIGQVGECGWEDDRSGGGHDKACNHQGSSKVGVRVCHAWSSGDNKLIREGARRSATTKHNRTKKNETEGMSDGGKLDSNKAAAEGSTMFVGAQQSRV